MTPSTDRRVLLAMSGGVDSSAAAALLIEAGWEVAGVTFKLFCYGEQGRESKACCGLEGVRDAQAVARRLGIAHTVLDYSELFERAVVDDFVTEYGRGRTPNPCVECNTHVKFAPLLSFAEQAGFGWIATGHYVRRNTLEIDGASYPVLRRAEDPGKDQTYVLWGVPPAVLARTIFPLGDLDKPAVREVARRFGLPVWDKGESQDICFVDGRGYVEVLRERLGERHPLFAPGPIADADGRVLGTHEGLVRYTVGQRRGLGLASNEPFHVIALEPESNRLRVGSAAELGRRSCRVSGLRRFVPVTYLEAEDVEVKIRYRQEPARARVRCRDDSMEVVFAEPQRAVAPGQSCVVYRRGDLLAGGRIEEAGESDEFSV